ncbi:MAG TPA: carboxypeptidase-like regulatory domain-containing protein, partial [Opitutaceae bacterium]
MIGTFTPREALEHLLANTGLTAIQDEKTGALMVNPAAWIHPEPAAAQVFPDSPTPDPNPPKKPMKKTNILAFASALLSLAVGPVAPAQSADAPPADSSARATGAIVGVVFDSDTGRALQGAIVSIPGTGYSDYTDAMGRFGLFGVPAGTHTLEVDYYGLEAHVQQVTVTGGSTQTINPRLTSSVLVLETLTVSDSLRGQALAINQQRTASGIVNIVSEETFGQMLDGNIGSAL